MERDTQRELPSLQWFPGHMKKAQRLIEENLKLVDVVVELRDARIPAASANPMLAEIIQGKPRVIALNKSDLADPAATKAWLAYFRARGIRAVAIDANKGKGMKQLTQAAADLARPKTEKFGKPGGRGRAARAGPDAREAVGEDWRKPRPARHAGHPLAEVRGYGSRPEARVHGRHQ